MNTSKQNKQARTREAKLLTPSRQRRRPAGGAPSDWSNIDQKRKVILKILYAILDNPELGKEYLRSDEKAAQAFREAGIMVPGDVKVVFLPAGDGDKLAGASAVIELPKVDPGKPRPTPEELLELVLANYHIVW